MPSSVLQVFKPQALRCIRRSSLALLAGLLVAAGAHAQAPVGDVTHLSGLLTARNAADGERAGVRLLAAPSVVHEGDVLATAAGTYAQVRFLDDAELTLGPDSQVSVVRYSWNPTRPQDDRVVIELLRGSLQAVTGRLGKRNHDAIDFIVPGGRIAVHGTTFVASFLPPTAIPVARPTDASSGLAPGLYVSVTAGMISLSNPAGASNITAGQFGFTPSFTSPPMVIPQNPAIPFTPPPVFTATPGTLGSSAKSGGVDCEVR